MAQQEFEQIQKVLREVQTNFNVFMNGFTGQGEFTIHNANEYSLTLVIRMWRKRRFYTSNNCLTLILTEPFIEMAALQNLVENMPSLKIIADGEQLHVPGYINYIDDVYYQGSVKSMLIFATKTADSYVGSVKSLEDPVPHGFGKQQRGANDRQNGAMYDGYFVNGLREGYGQEMKGNTLYKGNWKEDERNGAGLEFVLKKRKKNKNPSSASSQVGSSVRNEEKEGSENGSQNTLANSEAKDTDNNLEEIKQKQQQNNEEVEEKKEEPIEVAEEKKEEGAENVENVEKGKKQIQYEDIVEAEGDGDAGDDAEQGQEQGQGLPDFSKLTDEQMMQMLKEFKSIYVGNWQNGMKEDEKGKEFSKHNQYVGGWSQGVKNGFGKMTYKVGSVYEGQWKNNLLEGEGKYTDQAGNVYTGSFQGGEYHGQGTMQYVNEDKYEGEWKFGKKEGQGVYTFADGDYYDGAWVKDKAEGKGTSMTDGNFFDGQFSKGLRHGLGEESLESGETEVAIWKNNEKVKVISVDGELIEEQQ